MAINHPKAGANSVPAYQMSGIPFVTASASTEVPANTGAPLKLEFPYVTRFFQVQNQSSEAMRVGFSLLGTKGTHTKNFFVVAANGNSDVLELRTKELYFLSNTSTGTGYRVIAGLTRIDKTQFPVLTGSVTDFEGIG
jgi:hypothetical protein